MILVAVAGAGDHDVKSRPLESRRLVALPIPAVRVSALRAWPSAAVVTLWLVGMFFADEAFQAVAGHRLIVAELRNGL